MSTPALKSLIMNFQNKPLERLPQGEAWQPVMVAHLCLPHHVVQNVTPGLLWSKHRDTCGESICNNGVHCIPPH